MENKTLLKGYRFLNSNSDSFSGSSGSCQHAQHDHNSNTTIEKINGFFNGSSTFKG